MSLRRHLALFAVLAIAAPATASASAPANGRAFELVTRGEPTAAIFAAAMAIDPIGTRVAYLTFGAPPGALGGDLAAANMALREGSGWASKSLSPAYPSLGEEKVIPSYPIAFSRDLSTTIVLSEVPLTAGAPPEGQRAIYRRDESGAFALLAAVGNPEPSFVRSSPDTQRIIFTTSAHLLPADADRQGSSVYEISGASLRMVDLNEAGEVLSLCGASVPPAGVSASAQRVFFASPGSECSGPNRIYLREGGTTVEASVSHCTRPDCNPPQNVRFAGATPSGSEAFLVTAQQLTNADVDEAPDLYRYEVGDGGLTLLSLGPGGANGAVEEGDVASTADGSEVYFFADGRLIPGQGSADGPNLYLSDQSGLHFLASLPAATIYPAAVGGSALLETAAALDESDADEHVDVYRYDVASDRFSLLSRGPAGGDGPFDATLESSIQRPLLGPLDTSTRRIYPDAGDRAFFVTAERLLPADDDDSTDLYEWTDGTVGLLTPGTADEISFDGVSPDGSTALFESATSLVPADRNAGEHDLYAARIGGGFAEPQVQVGCGGSDCGRQLRDRPARPSLGSAGASADEHGGKPRIRRIRVGAEGAVATVLVRGPGLVLVRGEEQVGDDMKTVVRGRVGAIRRGTLRVPLQLSAALQRRLRRGLAVPTRFTVRQGDSSATERVRLSWSAVR